MSLPFCSSSDEKATRCVPVRSAERPFLLRSMAVTSQRLNRWTHGQTFTDWGPDQRAVWVNCNCLGQCLRREALPGGSTSDWAELNSVTRERRLSLVSIHSLSSPDFSYHESASFTWCTQDTSNVMPSLLPPKGWFSGTHTLLAVVKCSEIKQFHLIELYFHKRQTTTCLSQMC